MKTRSINSLLVCIALLFSVSANANPIVVDPSFDNSGCCTSTERGYYFTTVEELTFTSFWLNTANGLSTNYNLDVLLLNTTPPQFNDGSTTDFVTLGQWDGLSGMFNTNITVAANSIIGLLAWDANFSTTPYAKSFDQIINGETYSFLRLVRQSLVNGDPVSAEGDFDIGAIGFEANGDQVSVSSPTSIAMLAFGLIVLATRRFKN